VIEHPLGLRVDSHQLYYTLLEMQYIIWRVQHLIRANTMPQKYCVDV